MSEVKISAAAFEVAEYIQALCIDQALGGKRTLRWEGPSTSHVVAGILARHSSASEARRRCA